MVHMGGLVFCPSVLEDTVTLRAGNWKSGALER